MDVNYELYKVFYQVASTLSFSEASKNLFISQSAVSQSIKTLEKKLEQQLFIRSTKKVQLTQAGELLYKHIEPAISLIERGESQLVDSQGLGLGQLHIGASDTICRYFLVPYLQEFHRLYPSVPIKVTNATSLGCVDLLEQGKVNLIVTNAPNTRLNPSYIQKKVKDFKDVFIINPESFPDISKQVSLKELAEYPLITLTHHSSTTEFLRQMFLHYQLELMPEIELSSNDLLIDLARIGLGAAFVPDYCVHANPEGLLILDTKEKTPSRQLVASVNTTLPTDAATEAFLALLPTV